MGRGGKKCVYNVGNYLTHLGGVEGEVWEEGRLSQSHKSQCVSQCTLILHTFFYTLTFRLR